MSCEAAARKPSGRRRVVTVMGFGYRCGGAAFQQSSADNRRAILLKVRNVKLEKSLISCSSPSP